MAKKVVLEVPDDFQMETSELMMLIATRLYAQAKLSLGHAAAFAGIDKRSFIERMGEYGVSVFNHSVDDYLRDVKNA